MTIHAPTRANVDNDRVRYAMAGVTESAGTHAPSSVGRAAMMVAAAGLLLPLTAQGQTSGEEIDAKGLVWEAWRAVSEQYYDPEFGGADWPAIGGDYLSRSYDDVEAAHTAVREMLARLDNPATRLLTADQATALLSEFDGNLGDGTGLIELLSVDADERTGEIVVVTPVPYTPAAKAGLRTGDVIVSVDGQPTETLDLAGTMSALRGRRGETIRVVLSRNGSNLEIPIEVEPLERAVAVESSVQRLDGATIGYIGLRLFTESAAERFLTTVREMEDQDVDAYVLDLRNNPGGYVNTLQQVAGALLGRVPLASLRVRGDVQSLMATGERLTDARWAALVNEGTASAAEVLASALQHHDRAVVVGAPTFGKGLAHGFTPLSDGSAVTPTIGRLVSLDGVDILDHGFTPEVEIRSAEHPVVDPDVEVGSEADIQFHEAVKRLNVSP